MKIGVRITKEGGVLFEGVDPLFLRLLGEIRDAAELDDPRVESRIYQEPTDDPDAHELREDWKAFVQPELHSAFTASRDVVEADLRRAATSPGPSPSLLIPRPHIDHWLSALNQARLALSEFHDFDENDMDRPPADPDTPRSHALLQMHIYGLLQEWLVSVMD
jgi:hypothetical protein